MKVIAAYLLAVLGGKTSPRICRRHPWRRSFLFGVFCSVRGYVGMWVSVRANVWRQSAREALQICSNLIQVGDY
ncbi:putative inorganic diphosphatase [Rosa chinensis]|uniref:Putative inorganic diphosphatase n=1 Tax=Rosa chinensis TaxID=74649 RepID=A0A2P6RI24_ROSCH|nr:putative inorganic diphosphatase [Rosa chinensis]